MNVPSSSRAAPLVLSETQYDQDWCRRRCLPSCNAYMILKERETGHPRYGTCHYTSDNDFYSTIRLDRNMLVGYEQTNRNIFMGWTPDGNNMIAFTVSLRTIKVFEYLGVNSVMDCPPDDFLSKLFRLRGEINMPYDSQVRYEGLFFTNDSQHFIVVGIATVNNQIPDTAYNLERIYSHRESLPVSALSLEEYTFVCVETETAKVCGVYRCLPDRISITHGINVCGRYLMIHSHHQQVIHIVQIASDTGKLVPLRVIGYSVHEDDSMHLLGDLHDSFLRTDLMTGLKQRLNTYLFKRAKKEGRIIEYLREADYRSNLRLDRVGIFDDYYLLIRMLPFNVIIGNNDMMGRDPNLLPCFYAIMDWRNAQILDVFEEYDQRFLNFYEQAAEYMAFPISEVSWPGAEQFKRIANQTVNRYRRRIIRSHSDSRRRVLNQLPLPALHANKVSLQSPYLDPKYFQIEDRFQMTMLCGKMRMDYHDNKEIRIVSRRTNSIFLRLSLAAFPEQMSRQVSMLFHPTDPLCIAIERQRQETTSIVYLPSVPDLISDEYNSSNSSPKSTDRESSTHSSHF